MTIEGEIRPILTEVRHRGSKSASKASNRGHREEARRLEIRAMRGASP
ncbi:hypothetical protein LA76x_4151 [Lysobacter antibioticus]|uniref:Uncharacterized protein n=1 Tax=Lysobacter antibioticus TaxID=84531 RepID=A0A0S2FFH8_LYSAN|nr:hypothetical protein LA76x_4151 [Lysobacter antibioticus]